MMFKWIDRLKRVDTLESEVAALTGCLAEAVARIDVETERSRALSDKADLLGDRLSRQNHDLNARLDELTERLARIVTRTDRLEEGKETAMDRVAEAQDRLRSIEEDIGALRVSLLRLDHRFDLHAEDAHKTATALLERIELAKAAIRPQP